MHRKILGTFLIISLVFSLGLSLWLLQEDHSAKETPAALELNSSYPKTEDNWTSPVSLSYDTACLIQSAHCLDLGQAQIGMGEQTIRARLFPIENDREHVEVRFYTGDEEWFIPRFKTSSFLEANSSWFGLKIWPISDNAIYIATSGGHEGQAEYFVSHLGATKPTWENFTPWDVLKNEFPDAIQPPFSLEVGAQYLRLTEKDACCDIAHSDNPERNANRKVYILRPTYDSAKQEMSYSVVEEGSTPRD